MVVMSGGWVKNAAPSSNGLEMINNTANMPPRAVLICRPNSHPFQERSLTLDQPVKIGRSVARARAVLNNAIFDCKVLSRNHALLWYENGKFYLQDTKSSNGTFVNNQRLSKGAEESPPREVCSGDIVQFGVDVMENTRKVTHGCIVATLKLYLPDGKEAKASPSTSVVSSVGMVPLEDLYQLNQYLQESLQRGQLFENKLAKLQHIVETMSQASELGWRALIDEDRLLSRVEILESQLQMYSKNFAEDKLREELRKLQEDKTQYQGTAKESLRKVLQEKLEALQKLQDLERSLNNAEEECGHLKNLCEQSKQDLQDLAQKYTIQLQKVEDLSSKLRETEETNKETFEKIEQEKLDLQTQLIQQLETQHNLQIRLESLQGEIELPDNQLTNIQSNLEPVVKVESRVDLSSLNKPTDSTGTQVDIILERIDLELTGENNMKEVIQHTQSNIDILRSQICKSEGEIKESFSRTENLYSFIEEVQLEEDSCLELTHEIHHQILRLEREINTSKENNKNVKDNEPGILNKLKDDVNKLEDILKETREKKKIYEQKLANCQSELESAKILIKKTSELGNLLKDQLQLVQNQYNKRSDTLIKQQEQITNLEASEILLKNETHALKEKLEEEKLNSEKMRQQLIEAQQNAKQSHNEAEQMKDRLNAMKLELTNQDNKDLDILESLQLHCSTLDEDNKKLKQRCLDLEQQNEKLTEDNKTFETTIQNEKSSKDENGLIQLQLISLQEELVLVKQVYAQCNEEKTQLSRHLAKLEQEIGSLSKGSASVSLYVVLSLIVFFFALWISSFWSM